MRARACVRLCSEVAQSVVHSTGDRRIAGLSFTTGGVTDCVVSLSMALSTA